MEGLRVWVELEIVHVHVIIFFVGPCSLCPLSIYSGPKWESGFSSSD